MQKIGVEFCSVNDVKAITQGILCAEIHYATKVFLTSYLSLLLIRPPGNGFLDWLTFERQTYLWVMTLSRSRNL
jgi:hypothetical protein